MVLLVIPEHFAPPLSSRKAWICSQGLFHRAAPVLCHTAEPFKMSLQLSCLRFGAWQIVRVSFQRIPPSPHKKQMLVLGLCPRGPEGLGSERAFLGGPWAAVCSGSGADLPPVPCPVSTWKILWGQREENPKGWSRSFPSLCSDSPPLPQGENPTGFSCGENFPTQIPDGVEAELFLCSKDSPRYSPLRARGIPSWNSPEQGQDREWLREPGLVP